VLELKVERCGLKVEPFKCRNVLENKEYNEIAE
jgi:hypothetical protein